MKTFPILYWPRKTKDDADYQLARKTINSACGMMPEIITDDLDLAGLFSANPDATVYYPVFCESTGWWGELLGAGAVVTDKVIISPECQLMVIRHEDRARCRGGMQLLAAEIYPASGFFKKMNSGIATVADMLATDAGTILALFSGRNQSQFINVLESTGNSYLGCIGRY
ncbi:MAG: hypothetical protein K2L95_01685 [Alphaproteobacteria bacterium]|nr:hypothetical protein [Alphaproteobacteria bacterium]MDE6570913.1 hypothetical protein [Alphaproteobacteria bacterium]